MSKKMSYILPVFFLLFSFILLTGCEISPARSDSQEPAFDDNVLVGEVTTLVQFQAVPVRGYGVVAGLPGTGSGECPPALRTELERFISKKIPHDANFNARRFLGSNNTAVVEVIGTIPTLASPEQTFDVRLIPFSRSQTLSLDGGYLYTTELKEMSRFVRYDQFARSLAEAHGQVFRDPFASPDTPLQWYSLGGGIVKNEVKISLAINQPSFKAASIIRNAINERFGSKTATAVSEEEIRLRIPARFHHNKLRFLQMIRSIYLSNDPENRYQKRDDFLRDLVEQDNKYPAEIALEAFGKNVVQPLKSLLSSSDPAVRFHAARCLLYIGDENGFNALRETAMDPSSPYRIDSIKAFEAVSGSKPVENVLVQLVADPDIQIRIAACDQLLNMNSFSVKRMIVADSFVIDTVFSAGPKAVYVFCQKAPRIVLFGSPIRCSENMFIQSDDGTVTINALPGSKYLSVSRKHPNRPRVIGPIKSTRDLASLIRILGESSEIENRITYPGLSIPYMNICQLLKKICDNEAVAASFYVGPLAQISY